MKHILIRTAIMALAMFAGACMVSAASGMGAAFTYQGKLTAAAADADGKYDFQFRLYDAASGGSTQGPLLTATAVAVSNGLFAVTLDFGNVYNGDARWLAIWVKPNGAPAYTPLEPRQPLTPGPYALYAGNAALFNGQAASAFAPATGSSAYVAKAGDTMTGTLVVPADGFRAGANQLALSGGNVGIGTATPQAKLHVNGVVQADGDLKAARLNVGSGHTLSGGSATISGGWGNAGTGGFGAIGGGHENTASADSTTVAGGYHNTASSGGSSVVGGDFNRAAAEWSFVGGGNTNTASGSRSVASGGEGNVASGPSAAIAGGWYNIASQNASTVSGGANNTSAGAYSAVGGGGANLANGNNSFVAGGDHNVTEGSFSVAQGAYAKARVHDQHAIAGGAFNASLGGDAQASTYILRRVTANSSMTELFLDGGGSRIVVPRGSTWTFEILVVARSQDGGDFGTSATAGFRIWGTINHDGSGTFLHGATGQVLYAYDPSWAAYAEADNANGALVVKVVGGNVGLRWVAAVRTVEVMWPQ